MPAAAYLALLTRAIIRADLAGDHYLADYYRAARAAVPPGARTVAVPLVDMARRHAPIMRPASASAPAGRASR